MRDDNLIRVGFLGTRALTKKDLAADHLTPEPPRLTQNQFVELVKAWPGGFFEEGLREVLD